MLKNAMSKQVVENTDPLHYMTDQQKQFIEHVLKGDPPQLAARKAGYQSPKQQAYTILKSPKMQAAIRFCYHKYGQAAQMTRKRVMDGLLEAIEMAKLQADAGNMVNGWREIGRMCGYYAPEVKKIDISVTTRRVVDQLETLSDDALLEMVENSGQTIEGTAEKVLERIQDATDRSYQAEFEAYEHQPVAQSRATGDRGR